MKQNFITAFVLLLFATLWTSGVANAQRRNIQPWERRELRGERFALTGEKSAQTGEICLAIDENGAGMLMNCERIGVKAHLDLNFWLTGENYAATRVNCG